jgi:hypothetical protein
MSIAEDAPGKLRGEFAFKDPATGTEATVRFGDEHAVKTKDPNGGPPPPPHDLDRG